MLHKHEITHTCAEFTQLTYQNFFLKQIEYKCHLNVISLILRYSGIKCLCQKSFLLCFRN